jgi:hypothetical protein
VQAQDDVAATPATQRVFVEPPANPLVSPADLTKQFSKLITSGSAEAQGALADIRTILQGDPEAISHQSLLPLYNQFERGKSALESASTMIDQNPVDPGGNPYDRAIRELSRATHDFFKVIQGFGQEVDPNTISKNVINKYLEQDVADGTLTENVLDQYSVWPQQKQLQFFEKYSVPYKKYHAKYLGEWGTRVLDGLDDILYRIANIPAPTFFLPGLGKVRHLPKDFKVAPKAEPVAIDVKPTRAELIEERRKEIFKELYEHPRAAPTRIYRRPEPLATPKTRQDIRETPKALR